MSRLLHHTPDPFTLDRDRTYEQRHVYRGKPSGLWVSVEGDDDWRSWCIDNEYENGRLHHTSEITLDADARILHITNAADLDAFTDAHRAEHPASGPRPTDRYSAYIDWAPVINHHQGIIIAPYIWSRRLELAWYYTWDCASGCIWDLTAIADVTALTDDEARS